MRRGRLWEDVARALIVGVASLVITVIGIAFFGVFGGILGLPVGAFGAAWMASRILPLQGRPVIRMGAGALTGTLLAVALGSLVGHWFPGIRGGIGAMIANRVAAAMPSLGAFVAQRWTTNPSPEA